MNYASKVVEALLESDDLKDFLDRNDGAISKPPYTRYEDVLAAVKDHELFNDHDPGRFITFTEISGFRDGNDVAWEVYLDFKPEGITVTPLYWYIPAEGDGWQELEDIEEDYPGNLQHARAYLNGEITKFLASLSELVAFSPPTLQESDDIDPKEFVDRVQTVDLNELRALIREALPKIELVAFHLIGRNTSGTFRRYELYVYTAKRPVSADGFDPLNRVDMGEQRTILKVVLDWASENDIFVRENNHLLTSHRYKGLCEASLIRFTLDVDETVEIVGDDSTIE